MRGRSGFASKRWGQRLLVTTFSGYLSAIIAPATAADLHPRERASSSVLALVIQRPPQLSTPSVGPGASYSLRSTDPSASCTHRHPRDALVGLFAGHADSTFPTDTPRFFPFRFPACREFFQALEACHANFWTKWTGGCNTAKNQLNSCLHKEVSGASRSSPLFIFAQRAASLTTGWRPWSVHRKTAKTQRSGKPRKNRRGRNCTRTIDLPRPSSSDELPVPPSGHGEPSVELRYR